MVRDRLSDGVRIAQLLASELGTFAVVTDADPDVDPTPDGAFAYAVRPAEDTVPVAEVYVHPDRVRVAFDAVAGVLDAASDAGLRVRPTHARTLVFVEDGAEVKRVRAVFEAALDDYRRI